MYFLPFSSTLSNFNIYNWILFTFFAHLLLCCWYIFNIFYIVLLIDSFIVLCFKHEPLARAKKIYDLVHHLYYTERKILKVN